MSYDVPTSIWKRLLQHLKRYQIIDNKIMPLNDEDTHTKYAHTHFRSKVLYGLYVNEEILWIIQ